MQAEKAAADALLANEHLQVSSFTTTVITITSTVLALLLNIMLGIHKYTRTI
jgi:hypothetical protein